jgi:hypothetical protein
MTEKTIDLGQRRGMAAQKATDLRRLPADLAANEKALPLSFAGRYLRGRLREQGNIDAVVQGGRNLPAVPLPVDPALHCLTDACAEAAAAECGLFGQKLAVDPGRSRRRDLRLDRKVRSDGELQALAAAGFIVGSCFDDGPRLGVAGHLQIGKDSVIARRRRR